MKRQILLAAGIAILFAPAVLPTALSAQTNAAAVKATPAKPAPAKAAGYRAPRNALGQPNLSGDWSNASLTPEQRDIAFGTRALYTREEAAAIEGDMVAEVQRGNARIDPDHPIPKKGGDGPQAIYRQTFIQAGGVVGGYDRGWLDPGSQVMRVHGEMRNSILTTPNGRPPVRKAGAVIPALGRGVVVGGGEGEEGGGPPAAGRGGGGRGGAAAAGGGRGGGGANAAGQYDNPEQRPLAERCVISFGRNAGPPMMANGYYNNNYRLVQGKDSVAIQVEMVHDTRIVRLNAKHRTDGIRPYFGDSIGHYEGDTLVVETTNIPSTQAYNGAWRDLTVTERFTRVSPTRLLYQFSIKDPTQWDAAWGGEYEFSALGAGQRVEEYACHEGNYALEGILAGARRDEALAAAGQRPSQP